MTDNFKKFSFESMSSDVPKSLSSRLLTESILRISSVLYRNPNDLELLQQFRDTLSAGQLLSKYRLFSEIERLELTKDRLFFIGHWHALLPFWLLKSKLISSAIGIELDQFWVSGSKTINEGLNWTSFIGDIQSLHLSFYHKEKIDMVVNSSCEHMSPEWQNALPSGIKVLIQSTNYNISEHICLAHNLQHFSDQYSQIKIIESNVDTFEVYERYTIYGEKY